MKKPIAYYTVRNHEIRLLYFIGGLNVEDIAYRYKLTCRRVRQILGIRKKKARNKKRAPEEILASLELDRKKVRVLTARYLLDSF